MERGGATGSFPSGQTADCIIREEYPRIPAGVRPAIAMSREEGSIPDTRSAVVQVWKDPGLKDAVAQGGETSGMRSDGVQRSDLTRTGLTMSGNIYMLVAIYYKAFDIILR
jgi:hypothetical protein